MKKKPNQKRRAFKSVRTDGCILECLSYLHHHPENCSPLWTEQLRAEAKERGLALDLFEDADPAPETTDTPQPVTT